MAGKGILLGEDGDLLIQNNSIVIGDTLWQETAIIMTMNQGEHKFYPVLGPNLIQLKKAKASRFDIEQRLKLHLGMDRKNYDLLKEQIRVIK
jgi:hypothetical protein